MHKQATLSAGSDRRQRVSVVVLSAWLVMGVAALVMLGWLVQRAWMVQLIPGTTAMVFSNALCLFLLGTALQLTTVQWRWRKPLQMLIGVVVMLVGGTVMLQYHLDLALPLDLTSLHSWLNGSPGRMAPNIALAHAFAGLSVLLTIYARPGIYAMPALLAAFAVGILGVTGLVGYRINPELLYGWHIETRMPLHTGAAFFILSSAFIMTLYRAQQLEEFFRKREDLRVGLLGGGLMVLVGLVGGLTAFSLMQEQMVAVLQDGLKLSFQSRHDLIESEIQSTILAAQDLSARPVIRRELNHLRTDPENQTAQESILAALNRYIKSRPDSLRLLDVRGHLIASAGTTPATDSLVLPLQRHTGEAAIVWDGRAASLHTVQPILDNGQPLGRIEASYPLPAVTRMRDVALGFGASGDMVLCVKLAQRIRCLPTTLAPQRTEIPPATHAGPVLMVRALAGERSVGLATDYRGEWVIAVHGPVADLGLGLVLKVDVAEVYAPIRQRFELTLLVTVLIIAVGILLLRARLVPLVRQLALAEKRIRSVLEAAPDAMIVTDLDGRIEWVNSQTERLFGYTAAQLIGQPVELLVPERLREVHKQKRTGYADEPHYRDVTTPLELQGRRRDGSEFPAEIGLSPFELEDGMRVISTVRDISERQRALQTLRDSEQRWQFALEGTRDGVWDWNLVTNEVFFSRQWKAMLGHAEHEISASLTEWDSRMHPDDKARVYADIEKHLHGETPYYQNEHRMLCKDGSYKWILDRGMIDSRDADGKPTRMIGTHTDITDLKQTQETIRELSLVDELTGLRNRRGFFFLAESQLGLARRLGRSVVLFFADMDGLKLINDTLGHAQGDRALKDFADALRTIFREADVIARLGGDEFAVLALETPNADTFTPVSRIEAYMKEFNHTAQRPYRLAASIGVAQLRQDSNESLTALLERADASMYTVKQQHHAAR